jgi:hypothetical protein
MKKNLVPALALVLLWVGPLFKPLIIKSVLRRRKK